MFPGMINRHLRNIFLNWPVNSFLLSNFPHPLYKGNHKKDKTSQAKGIYHFRDFPRGAVVKNPPANAGDKGSNTGPRRSQMPRSNEARAPQLLSLHSRAREPQPLSSRAATTEARVPRAHALQQEKPPQGEACAPQGRVAPSRRN